MKRNGWIVGLAAAVALAAPAYAGGEHCRGKEAAQSASADKSAACTATAQECLDHMVAKFDNKGWVGIELEKDKTTGTMTVTRVVPDSPAVEAGFQEGDVLVALNGCGSASRTSRRSRKRTRT